ncbi:MAG TPA: putative metal-binding motif-containing protein, partial [Candidatus Polarisedimenticolia bacterium]|nr:putative metal-binding motif-containing protein [Candidatus Polarisedimenticolia bacterium]
GTSEGVSLVATADGFGAAWSDARSGHYEVFMARLDAAGRPLSEMQVTREDTTLSIAPKLAWNGAEFRIGWTDARDSGSDVYVAAIDALGVRTGPETPLSSHFSHTAGLGSVALAGSALGAAWSDHRDGDFEIYFGRLGCHCVDDDADGYSACAECDDQHAEINPGVLEACNGEDDNCDGLADNDSDGYDSDSDAVPNACDNCRFTTNLDQADLDADGVGDRCDLDDGLIMVMMRDATFVEWQMEAGAASFNLYRGAIPGLVDPDHDGAASNYGGCLATGVAGPAYGDVAVPPLGTAFLYIVTGGGPGGETSFGVASSGASRPNVSPCP